MTPSERLGTGTRVVFALPAAVGAAMALLLAVYLTKFYVDVVALPAGIMAVAIAAGRAFDAITDPVMGWLSDRTRSRFGRRLPWIAAGVLGNAVMFWLLLNPPRVLPEAGLAGWAVGALLLSFLFVTLSNVPRQALAVELTLDQGERQQLFAAIAGFAALGTVIGAVLPNVLAGAGIEDERARMSWQATLYVGAYLAANALFLWRIRERREFAGRGRVPLVPGVRRALRNRPFRVMFASHVITAIPFAMPATLMPFYADYVLGVDQAWVGYFLVAYLVSGLVALPVWLMVAEARGKLTVWLAAAFVAVTGGASLFFMGPGDERTVLFLHVYVGLQSAVWLFVGGAMHADVVDYDELLTGKRREAQFSALWAIIPKFALIPGASLPLAILGGMGYVPGADSQSPQVVLAIKCLYALVPAALNALGLSIMWWYPLSESRHAAVRAAVARHARGEAVADPITGATLPPPAARPVDEATAWRLDHFSRAELRRLAAGDGRRVLTGIRARVLGWLAAAGILFALVPATARGGLETDPGPWPSLAIVAAGLALTAALFHAARLGPARGMCREPVAAETVRAHLDALGPFTPALTFPLSPRGERGQG
ncbi:major facilitator transporter [Salinisphaera sp. PC39]|uniref:MFS transporter n=1 Tax=Salinisphaera sp. PC39 TaxID=1304156 RepID=UPI00333E1C32